MEKLIYDTGKIPLLIRIVSLPFALFGIYLSGIVSYTLFIPRFDSGKILPLILTFALTGFLISLWVLRNRIYYNNERREVIIRHRGLFGLSTTVQTLEGAQAIYIHTGTIRASTHWDIGIKFKDGRKVWLTRKHADGEPTANYFASAIGLEVIQE